MKRDLACGIDSSTQSCTVMLRSLDDGAIVADSRAPHPKTTPPRSEQSPLDWAKALKEALIELEEYLPRIACVSVGGQGHGLVMLDSDDMPLRPAKLWNDTESAPDAERLLGLLPKSEWERRTGSIPAPALTISKLAWTERNHPGMVASAARVMLPFDYIIYFLTGRAVTERGGASGTGYFSPFEIKLDFEILSLALPGIDFSGKLPEIIGSSDRAGEVREIEGLIALSGAIAGAGSGDNMAAALGLDAREGDLILSLGTSGTIYSIVRGGNADTQDGAINGYADATGRFMPMVTTLNAAKVTDEFRRLIGLGVDEFDDMVLSAPPGAGGLTLLPYLDGERTPNLPFARGSLYGLRSDTTRGEFARAAVEGVVCGLLDGREALVKSGVTFGGRFILTGGAARSRSYRQILADMTGEEIWVCPVVETASAGACVQAAAAYFGADAVEMSAKWAFPLERAAVPSSGMGDSARNDIRNKYGEISRKFRGDYHGSGK
jgi:xylulokinase